MGVAQQGLQLGVSLLQAVGLAYPVLLLAHGLATRWFRSDGALVRWVATVVVAAALGTLLFHALMALGAFRIEAALFACALLLAFCRLRIATLGQLHAQLRADLLATLRLARGAARGLPGAVRWVFALFAGVALVRCLVVPPIAWDTLTYHYVKAALWVQGGVQGAQAGGATPFAAPGGWTIYGPRLGGGELYSAWAMLPFHGDAAAGLVDFAWWAVVGLALSLLGRELGLRARERLQVVAYGLFVPSLWLGVGSGYVDATLTALLLLGLFFGIRHLRRGGSEALMLSLIAFSLAASVKLTSAAVAAVAIAALLVSTILRERHGEQKWAARLGTGLGVGALIVAPWLVRNWLALGYPFEVPLTLFGLKLGADLPALEWYLSWREIPAYDPAVELEALSKLFAWPWQDHPHLSALSVLPMALMPLGLVRLLRSSRMPTSALLLYGATGLAVLAVFYAPDFSIVRILWWAANGRFLAPLLLLALPLSFAALPRRSAARAWLGGYLAVATGVHLVFFGLAGWSQTNAGWGAATGVALALLFAALALVLRNRSTQRTRLAAGFLAFVAGVGLLATLAGLRAPATRYALVRDTSILHSVEKYWVRGAKLVDEPGVRHRIAVTAGAHQDADNWFLYPFLGSELQNTVHYVPISPSGDHIEFGPSNPRHAAGDYETWARRLRATRISHVVSFDPASIELAWMSKHPGMFERLAGTRGHWGLYRLRRARR